MTETTTTEAPAIEAPADKPAKAEPKTTDCECGNWEIGRTHDAPAEGGEPEVTIETTGCDSQTRRVFAPGHDAKLKSLLIKAGVYGMEVRTGRDSGLLQTMDAATAASRFEFANMVEKGIEAGKAKLAARDERDAKRKERAAKAKAPRQVGAKVREEVPVQDLDSLVAGATGDEVDGARGDAMPQAPAVQDDWRPAQVKVGRWTYDALIDRATGEANYVDGNGRKQVAKLGKYAEV
jgi:hypothetical protein